MKDPSTRLELFLLGPPQVILPGGEPAEFTVDYALLLLAYLALEPQKAFRRSDLAASFYPDSTRKQASQNLRTALHRLHQTLGNQQADPPYLLCSSYTLQFNAASDYWVDVAEFRALILATQRHDHRRLGVCRDCMARLAQAVELYRGELLRGVNTYEDTPFDDWLFFSREELQRKAIEALHALAQYHYEQGQFDGTETYTNRLLRLNELDELGLRLQMQVSALRGLRNQALQRYQEFKHRLAAELDAEPEPETIGLANDIQAGKELKPPGPPQRRDTLLTSRLISASALPNMLVPFVGREAELGQMARLLASRDCRLLTLVGPGGSGKTRLAMRAAADNVPDWPDGAWLVALDDPSAGDDLETALVNALGIPITNSTQATRFQIYDFLRTKELLLVLDNFERMINQADLVKALLYHVPKLKVIATSRQWLGIQGEQVMPMGGLDFPTDDDFTSLGEEELAQWAQGYSAVQLFVENAHRVEPRFELSPQNVGDIVRICRLVDGLPLAIEMASAWVRIFPCDQILARIAQNVDFLASRTKNVPRRQASFRESFEYSWRMLSEEEREMFLKVAVFRGSFSLEAAQEVTGASLPDLVSLKDKFLLRQFPGNRFDVHPLLVQYVTQRASLHRDLAREARDRHSTYYLTFLTERASTLTAEEVQQDLENIRAAWQWAAENDRLAELPPSLDALARFPELTAMLSQRKNN